MPVAAISPAPGAALIHGCHRSYGQDVTGWHRHDKSCRTLRGVVDRKKANSRQKLIENSWPVPACQKLPRITSSCRLLADCVAKVFLHRGSKIFRAVDATFWQTSGGTPRNTVMNSPALTSLTPYQSAISTCFVFWQKNCRLRLRIFATQSALSGHRARRRECPPSGRSGHATIFVSTSPNSA